MTTRSLVNTVDVNTVDADSALGICLARYRPHPSNQPPDLANMRHCVYSDNHCDYTVWRHSYTHRATLEPVGSKREPADLSDLEFPLDELVEQPWATLDHRAPAIDCEALTGKVDPVEPDSTSPGGVDLVQLVGSKRKHEDLTNPTFLPDKLVEQPWAPVLRAREPRTEELLFDILLKLEDAHAQEDSTNALSTQEQNRQLQNSRTQLQTLARLLQTGNLSEVSCLQPIKRRIVSLRHPYRFCPKCWIQNKVWVLKSIKLPDSTVKHLHPPTCPSWGNNATNPTKHQLQRYGAAYKRAQRTQVLHKTALMAFKSAMPEATEGHLSAYIRLR